MWDPMYPLYGYVLCWNLQELFVRKSYHLHFRLSTLAHKHLKDFINISLCATLVSQMASIRCEEGHKCEVAPQQPK